MALIDRLILAVYKYRAQELIVAPGEKVTLAIGESRRPVSAEAATRQQVESLLREILPGHLAAATAADGNHEFPYSSPSGSVKVRVERGPGTLRLRAVPMLTDENGEASPAMPAASDSRRDPPRRNPLLSPIVDDEADRPSPSSDSADPGKAAEPAAVPASPARSGGTQAMEELLMRMVREGCSDLHLCTGTAPFFRRDGDMVPLSEASPMSEADVRELLFSITPRIKREEFETRHDTDFAHEILGVARFRCNLFVDRMGVGGVLRQIPSKVPTAEQLGLSRQILQLCELSKGLVLVTGPTGSGKSTTLAALVDYINRNRTGHIITIEDPIEFVHGNQKCLLNQREVGTHTEGFKEALRAALREDPDCILVGEMRDLETIAIAIETAETGHLVFGTLHTNTAASTVDRMIDQFPADRQNQVRTMLSESLKGVLSQTLCKKKGGGRVAALEVLLVTSAVSNLIREGKAFQITSVMQTGKGLGMCTLNDALMDLVQKGLVSVKEAYFKSVSKSEFKALLERNNFKIDAA
jgi:twitching motility protein PilT